MLDELPHRVLGVAGLAAVLQRNTALEHRAALDRATAQLLGCVLVLLVFEQAANQLLARVEHLFLIVDRLQGLRRRHQLA